MQHAEDALHFGALRQSRATQVRGCMTCMIAMSPFQTDPENNEYELEAGATRNFEALRTAEKQAMKDAAAREEELQNNPMLVSGTLRSLSDLISFVCCLWPYQLGTSLSKFCSADPSLFFSRCCAPSYLNEDFRIQEATPQCNC